MAQSAQNSTLVLNSWKEIASFLNRGVRTVQRWEMELQLPVHRIGKGRRSPVYALTSELKFWLVTSGVKSETAEPALKLVRRRDISPNLLIETSRRLVSQSHELVRSLAQNSIRQQQQAELLQKRVKALKYLNRMR